MTVHYLRKLGFKVTIHHNRFFSLPDEKGIIYGPFGKNNINSKMQYYARGGKTEVTIVLPGDAGKKDKVVTANAVCSMEDNYNRKIGVAIALGRALKMQKSMEIKEYINKVVDVDC